jgi:hypothetical protein
MRSVLMMAFALALALTSSPVLAVESHEVDDAMIESASTPAQHQEIAGHYKAQAEKARAAAKRHRAMAQVYSGGRMARSPSLPGTHCKKLADSYDAQAAEYDALAQAHEAESKK